MAFLFEPSDQRLRRLRQNAAQYDVSIAEMLRRLIDYGLTERGLNEMFPAMSGQAVLTNGETRY